jgi:hypothetical protein
MKIFQHTIKIRMRENYLTKRDAMILIQKDLHHVMRRKIRILFKFPKIQNSSKKQLLRGLKNYSILRKREKILKKIIKWSIRPRCVRIGKNLESANFRQHVLLHMDSMNFKKRNIFQQITKQKYAINFILHHIVLMEVDANSYILNMIFLDKNIMLIIT